MLLGAALAAALLACRAGSGAEVTETGGAAAPAAEKSPSAEVPPSAPVVAGATWHKLPPGRGGDGCLTFAGDVMLGRNIGRALAADTQSPWRHLGLRPGEAWIGNFEGVVASPGRGLPCAKPKDLCLAVEPAAAARLASSPFVAFSLANNHSLDLGAQGLRRTVDALGQLGIAALTEEGSPHLFSAGEWQWAVVAVSLVGRSAGERQRALEATRLRLSLARGHTPLVVAFVHWGREYDILPDALEVRTERILREWGAAVVMGAHTHVIQGERCDAEGGGATYYGLGNHLFDQFSGETRRGLLVRCCPRDGGLTCAPRRTERSPAEPWPRPSGEPAAPCSVLTEKADLRWKRHPLAQRFQLVQPFSALGDGHFFALRPSPSRYFPEPMPAPLVFRVEGRRLVQVWNGTALAWPLVAARLFQQGVETLLCAIHRDDSFLRSRPETLGRRRAVYRWNGFGFSIIGNPAAQERCEEM